MKKWSRIIALLLVAIMMFTMVVSCNKPNNPNDDDPTPPSGPSEPSGPSNPSGPSEPSGPSNPSGPSEPELPLTNAQILAAIKAAGVSTLNSTVKAKFEGAIKAPALGVDDYKIPDFEKELEDITIDDVDATELVKALIMELAFVSGEDTKYENTAELLEALVSALGSFNTNFETDYGSIEGYLADTLLTDMLADSIASLAADIIAPEKTVVVYVDDFGGEFDANNEPVRIEWYWYDSEINYPYCFWNEELGKYELAVYDEDTDTYSIAGVPVDPEATMYAKVTYTGRVYDLDAYEALVEDLKAPVSALIRNIFKGAALSVLLDDVNAICELTANETVEKLVNSVAAEVDKLEAELADGENYALAVTVPAIYEAIKANSDITGYDDNKVMYDRMFAILLGEESPIAADDYASAFAIVYSEMIAYVSAKGLVDYSPKYEDERYDSTLLYEKDGVLYASDNTEYVPAEGTYLDTEREVVGYVYFDTDAYVYAGATLEAAQAAYPDKDIYARVLCTVIGFDPAEYEADLLSLYDTFASILEEAIYNGNLTVYDIAASGASFAGIIYYMMGGNQSEPDDGEHEEELGGGVETAMMEDMPAVGGFLGDYADYSLITLLAKADFDTAVKEVLAAGLKLGYEVKAEAKLASDFANAVAAAEEAFLTSETGDYLSEVVLKVVSDVLADEENAESVDMMLGTGMSAEIKFFADYYMENGGFEKEQLIALCDTVIAMMGEEANEMAMMLISVVKDYALSLEEGVDTVTVDGIIIAVLTALSHGENAETYIDALEAAMASGDPDAIANAFIYYFLSEGGAFYEDYVGYDPDADLEGEGVEMVFVDLIAMGEFVMALADYLNADEEGLADATANLIAKAEAADVAYTSYMLNSFVVGYIDNIGVVARLAHIVVDLGTLDIAAFEAKYGMSDKLLDAVSALVANMYYMTGANNFEINMAFSVMFEVIFKLTLTDDEYDTLMALMYGEEYTIYYEYVEGNEYYVEGNLSLEDFLARKAALREALGEYLTAYLASETAPLDNVYHVLNVGNALDPDMFGAYFDAYTDEEDPTHEAFYELVKDDVIAFAAMFIANYIGFDSDVSDVLATLVVAPERIVENAPEILAMANSGDYDELPEVKYILYVISAIGHLAMDDEALLENEVDFKDVLGFIPLPEGFEDIDYNALALNIKSKTDILAEIQSLLSAEVIPTVTEEETVILIDINLDYSFGVIVFDFDLDLEITLK